RRCRGRPSGSPARRRPRQADVAGPRSAPPVHRAGRPAGRLRTRRTERMAGGREQAAGMPGGVQPSPNGAGGRMSGGLAAGAAAGLAASVVQVVVGKTEQWLFLPHGETPDFAPRLVDRAFQRAYGRASAPVKWALG